MNPQWVLALVLVAAVSPMGVTAAGTNSGETIRVLQWNPHWECFVQSENCTIEAGKMLDSMLRPDDLDFASVLMFQDPSFTAPPGWKRNDLYCGRDLLQLYWRESRWEPLTQPGAEETGCLEPDDRPFVTKAFREKTTDLRVLITGAHFPHPGEIETGMDVLRDGIKKVMAATGIYNVAIIADTNNRMADRYGEPLKMMRRLEIPNADNAIFTNPVPTCCSNNNYVFEFDRVLANFGKDMKTTVMNKLRDARWLVGTFHLPLVGSWTAVDNTAALYRVRDDF